MGAMTTYRDEHGREWSVLEVSRTGVGARAEGDHLPLPTHALLRFESEGEIRWAHDAPLDWNNPERLQEIFKSAKPA
jgi:hypothetical protein